MSSVCALRVLMKARFRAFWCANIQNHLPRHAPSSCTETTITSTSTTTTSTSTTTTSTSTARGLRSLGKTQKLMCLQNCIHGYMVNCQCLEVSSPLHFPSPDYPNCMLVVRGQLPPSPPPMPSLHHKCKAGPFVVVCNGHKSSLLISRHSWGPQKCGYF